MSTCSLVTYCLPDTILSIGNIAVNKADLNLSFIAGKKEEKEGKTDRWKEGRRGKRKGGWERRKRERKREKKERQEKKKNTTEFQTLEINIHLRT